MELKKPNALSIYGVFIQIERHLVFEGEQRSWGLMGLNNPNTLSIYGLIEALSRKIILVGF